MKAVFSEKEKKDAFKIKKKLLTIWFILLAVTLATLATLITLNIVDVNRTGSRALKTPFLWISAAIMIVFGCGSIFFFDIKYRLTSRYCQMLNAMKIGLKEKGEGTFVELDMSVSEKDGVFFHSLMLDCPPIKRGDITLRKILVEKNHALPQFEKGEKIRFITHANILVAYERVETPVNAIDNKEETVSEKEN